MLLAKIDDTLIEAHPNMRASCPHCNDDVIAKCGTVKIWHWAHKNNECVYKTEPETEWHLQWKTWAKEHGFKIEIRSNNHIFDAFNPVTKTVFEFQHSPISQEELKDRSFNAIRAGYLINWIFDYRDKHINRNGLEKQLEISPKNLYIGLKWYNNKYSAILQNNLPIFGKIYLDVGVGWTACDVLEVRILRHNGRATCDFAAFEGLWRGR